MTRDKINQRKLLRKKLAGEAKLARASSLEMLAEFEKIEDSLPERNLSYHVERDRRVRSHPRTPLGLRRLLSAYAFAVFVIRITVDTASSSVFGSARHKTSRLTRWVLG